MRKVVLSLLVIFISIITVHAQITKGTSMICGSINYSSQKSDQTSSGTSQNGEIKNFGFTPSYGKAVKKNLVIGADLTYQNNLSKSSSNGTTNETKTNSFGVGVFARHYKNLGTSGFYLFLQSRLGANISDTKPFPSGNNKYKSFNIGVGLNPGIAYAITPKVHIETGLNNLFYAGYSKSTSSNEDPSYSAKSSTFVASVGLGSSTEWTVGVKFFFGT